MIIQEFLELSYNMYYKSRHSSSSEMNLWPGFVDALSSLLLVVMFVLMIFVVAQFYLSDLITGKDKSIDAFRQKIERLSIQLNFLKESKKGLNDEIDRRSRLEKELLNKMRLLDRNYESSKDQLLKEKTININTQKEIALLNDQLKEFNEQIQKLNIALKASEHEIENQTIEIEKLKLNEALVKKVQEMAKYRSDFLANLQKALGDRKDIRVEGDRFVFQSEVLFDSASAILEQDGAETIDKLSESLKEIITKIPKDINWVLRIDGHTDKRPITSKFQSNWELSFGRAMAVVRRLISQGIPANRLAATGFGENYPIDTAGTEEAHKKNRRIEIKLDQR